MAIISWNWRIISGEGTDEREMMNLLYVTVKALLNPKMDNRLIRCIYELRTMTEQGFAGTVSMCVAQVRKFGRRRLSFRRNCMGFCAPNVHLDRRESRISPSALYTMRFIATAPMGKLYTFTVKDEVLLELEHIIHRYTAANTDKRFRKVSRFWRL